MVWITDVQSDAADTRMCIKDSENVFSEEGCMKNIMRELQISQ